MANQTATNPLVLDTAGTIWTGKLSSIRQLQWIDDAADIADDDDLVIVINDSTITIKVQIPTTGGGAPVEAVTPGPPGVAIWSVGPFNPGIPVNHFAITTIDHGVLLVWR